MTYHADILNWMNANEESLEYKEREDGTYLFSSSSNGSIVLSKRDIIAVDKEIQKRERKWQEWRSDYARLIRRMRRLNPI